MTLQEFFQLNPEVAIAFSGGVDSAYLLYAACRWAKRVKAYYVQAEFQPQFELEDARRLFDELQARQTKHLSAQANQPNSLADQADPPTRKQEQLPAKPDFQIIRLSVLEDPQVKANPANRCYYCKQGIFRAIRQAAADDGFTVLLDGTNASDDATDRPGMKALQELSVRSPLRECGLTKDAIRQLSKEAGLFTWDKPAYACLATRIPTGEEITLEKLAAIEKAEGFLMALGFSDFRVRTADGHARIQLSADQIDRLLQHKNEILAEMKPLFKSVSLDLEERS